MEAIVLAGGLGTRLAHVVPDVPKAMAPVAGRPFLEYVLADLSKGGVGHAVLAVGYKKECIMEHFGRSFMGIRIDYSIEETALLTGGAIKQALAGCGEDAVFALNGDTLFHVPLEAMAREHKKSGAQLSVAVKELLDFDRYGTVRFDPDGWITGFEEKKPRKQGYINGGVYRIDSGLLQSYPDVFSFERRVLEEGVHRCRMRAFPADGYFIDIGVPEDYARAQRELS